MAQTAAKVRTQTWATGEMRLNYFNAEARRGFTLMELMVVIIIIGIMSAAIIPEMRGTFEDALLRSTGRDLVNVCSLANSRAVSLNQSCRVQINPTTGHFVLERKVRDHGRDNFIPLKDVSGAEGKLDSRITIEVRQPDEVFGGDNSAEASVENASSEVISFYADGTADAAKIVLRDRAGFQLSLQLNPVTSRIQIVEPTHE